MTNPTDIVEEGNQLATKLLLLGYAEHCQGVGRLLTTIEDLQNKLTAADKVVEAAKACDEYLNSSELNCLGSGSILHRDLRFNLKEYEAQK